MINETLKFLSEEVNQFLTQKLGASPDQRIVLGDIVKVNKIDSAGTNFLSNRGILSLINVEEERSVKHQGHPARSDTGVLNQSPLVLNLHIVFALNRTDYGESLKWLSCIIQYFQDQKVFTPLRNPSLNPRIQSLLVDMHSLSFEQLNQLWSVLGGYYLPSVLYKIRQITVDEDVAIPGGGKIQEVDLGLRK